MLGRCQWWSAEMIKLFYHNFDSWHTDGATVNQYSELIHTAQIFFPVITKCTNHAGFSMCLLNVLHLCCAHLSPFTFLDIWLIPFTWNIHFLFHLHFKLASVCFLWLLVWCSGRIFFLPPWLSFFLPPLSCSVCHTLSLPYELSFPLTSLSTSSCKESECLF